MRSIFWTSAIVITAASVCMSGEDRPAIEPQRDATTLPVATEQTVQAAPVDRWFYAYSPAESPKAAYLGVTTSPAQPALQKQLQLRPGFGLVVDAVDSGSPAEQAGVKQYDILHKLDDQLLVNAEQFVVLVRSYGPGSKV